MTAYYNEIDPAAVAILRQLIADGVIAPGDVDTRSIKDVQPDDLRGYTQCHFFAGGGLWSVAARMAGWPDARPLWTGSCPCQPFSAAGKGRGTDDPRHLWPDFHRLIRACRPPVVMGEQVAGAAGYGWLDGVRADLAGEDYASRGVDIPACSVDAPHQRNRLYWIAVAEPDCGGQAGWGLRGPGEGDYADEQRPHRQSGRPDGGELADCHGARLAVGSISDVGRRTVWDEGAAAVANDDRHGRIAPADGAGAAGVLSNADIAELQGQPPARQLALDEQDARGRGRNGSAWADAEWITCHDGKARRAKPGIRLLVDGLPGRVDLWRIGGNAIVPILAAEVIKAFIES